MEDSSPRPCPRAVRAAGAAALAAVLAAACLVAALSSCSAPAPAAPPAGGARPAPPLDGGLDVALDGEHPSTFSIVARDPATGALGVAVQSRFFGVGAVVPWLEPGVGAIATQAWANVSFGPRGLAALRQGRSADETLAELIAGDDQRDQRQVGIVDARGGVAQHTGARCLTWAGGVRGADYAAQGNILVGEETVRAMAAAFEAARGEDLAERLLRALEAGQRAGGDVRGQQSAALHVVREGAGYGRSGREVWLQVEDHPRPIAELRRLFDMQRGRDPRSRARRAQREGRFDDARRLLESSGAPVEGGDPWPYLDLANLEAGEIVRQGGEGDAAREARARLDRALEKAIACDPSFDNARYQAARILAIAGDGAAAAGALEKLLELNAHYGPRLREELAQEAGVFRGPAYDGLRARLAALVPVPAGGDRKD